jgi:hypothetical protein
VKRVVKAYLKTVTLAILVASMVLPMLVRAVDYVPGVKTGDWIKYGQFSITWSGNGTEPAYITEEKKMDWAKMEVENVAGTTIDLNMTSHYKNGTQTSATGSVDLNSSTGMSGSRFFIAANLRSRDPLGMSSQPNAYTINQTTTGIYAGAYRNIDVLDFTVVSTSVQGNQTVTGKFYWDQSTGVLVEMHVKQPDYVNPGAYTEISVKATETNMWSADFLGTLSNNLIYIIAGIIIIIAVIAAAIALRKKPSPSPQSPSAQTTETTTQDTKQE